MKHLSRIAWMCALLGLLPWVALATQPATDKAEDPRTVVVGVDHSPPYRIVNAGQHSGLYLDIFNEVAQRLGWQVRYERVPFRRILLLMREGKVDVMLGPVQTEARSAYMMYAAPAFPPERRLFFHVMPENRIARYDDLYGKTIGVLEGASYFERFDKDRRLRKEEAPRYQNLMMMLEKGRVDVVIAPELAGQAAARSVQVDARVSPYMVPGGRAWIAISKESPFVERTDEIARAVESIRRDGVMDRLLSKYSRL